MFHAKERFIHASRILTEEGGSLKARLHDAFVYHVMHIDRSEVPEDYLDDFDYIHSSLTAVDPGHADGVVAASLHALDEEGVREIASRILLICMSLLYL